MAETVEMASMDLRFLHTPESTGGILTMFEMQLRPVGRMPVLHHQRDCEETVYGLTWTTTWTVDGRTAEVGPGDSLHIPRGNVHGFTNTSAALVNCQCVLMPSVLAPAYQKEIAVVVARRSTRSGCHEGHHAPPRPRAEE